MSLESLLVEGSRATIAASGLLIVAGVVMIILGKRELHKRMMLTACALAACFVLLYLARSSLFPPSKYMGEHRGLYLSVLWSHTVLSLVNLPLAAATVYFALKGVFKRHRRIAPFTAAVWVYVAASGWTIFLFNG